MRVRLDFSDAAGVMWVGCLEMRVRLDFSESARLMWVDT